MDENKKPQEKIAEESEQIKVIKEAAENMAKKIRNDAMTYGARMMCSVILQIIDKHLNQPTKVSLRDYKRCITEIVTVVSVPLKKAEEEKAAQDTKQSGSEVIESIGETPNE